MKHNDVEYLQFKRLLEYKEKIQHCFTLKNLNFKNDEDLDKNYEKIMQELGISNFKIIRPKQEHTDNIKIIKTGDENLNGVDACITAVPKILLSLIFADCTPIILYDTEKNIIGLAHSGWKGTVKKIAYKTVLKMIDEFKINPENLIAIIGPTIRDCHFEVQEDVKQIFKKQFNEYEKFIYEKEGKIFIDTVKINEQLLLEAGVKKDNIIDCKICSVCNNDKIYSHRCHEDGRNTAMISLL